MKTYTLITGASSGIGAAIARRLGADRSLILGCRDAAKVNSADRHLVWTHDLRDVEHISASLGSFLEQHQATVDCFVHSAGVVKVMPARLNDFAAVQEVMNVNVLSAVQVVATLLKKHNKGVLRNLLFISSTYSIRGVTGQAAYSASKGALDAMMRSLAVELAPAVRVNSVLPGGVRTPMSERAFTDEKHLEKMKEEYLLRLGEVDDIVNAVEFLLSEKAGWITGQKFVVDGGQTAH